MRFAVIIVVVLLAVVFGLVTFYFSGTSPKEIVAAPSAAPAASEVATVDILVARNNIALGAKLTPDMVDRQPWPKNLVLEGFIVAGGPNANIEGMVARGEFKAREPLVTSKLASPNDASFLAAGLDPGMRAVTMAVDSISGLAGYLFPGDRVDVVLTHAVPQMAPDIFSGQQMSRSVTSTTTEVLLPAIRVLAVNNRKPPPPPSAEGSRPQPEVVEQPANVTLAMSQDDVKKLRLGEKNGTLSLALRALQDGDDNAVGLPVTLFDLSRWEGNGGEGKWRTGGNRAVGGDEVIIIRGVMAESGMSTGGGIPMGMPAPAANQSM